MFGHPHNKEIFPNLQPEPLLVRDCAVPVHPVIGYEGEETDFPCN